MIIVSLFVLGLCFGSFVNALVWRIHEQAKPRAKRAASAERLSITKGRSMCTHCKHELAWYDLLPLLSWFSLGGKCRYCHKPIGAQYPLVELLTAALFVLSYLQWPYGFDAFSVVRFALWLVAVICFMALLVYDFRWMLLPNRIIYPLVGLSILHAFLIFAAEPSVDYFASPLLGFLAIGGLFYVLFQVSQGRWIGGGDVKLGYAIGLLVGRPFHALLVIFIASCLGTVVALPQMLRGKLKASSRLAFGPFLIIATMVVYLWGQALIDWYQVHLLMV